MTLQAEKLFAIAFPFMVVISIRVHLNGDAIGVGWLFMFVGAISMFQWTKDNKEKKQRQKEWKDIQEILSWV